MAVDEQKYTHLRDDKIIENSFRAKTRGQYFVLIIAIIAITGGITCILFGYEISGSAVSAVGLTGLVSEFLGRSKKPPEVLK